MSNHYTKQVATLESIVSSKLKQLSLLEAQNRVLRARAHALESYQASLQGGLSASRSVLEVSTAAISGGQKSPETAAYSGASAPGSTEQQQQQQQQASSSDGSNSKQQQQPSSASQGTLLARLDEQEQQVQQLLQQMGCEGNLYDGLYTTWLLRRATARPARVAAHLAMTIPERMAMVTEMVEKFGILLPKYDVAHMATSVGTAKQQLDSLVDELSEKALIFGLLDPPHVHLSEILINMQTRQPESYPEGWWKMVVEAMELTAEQKAALKISWDKVKAQKTALTKQHQQLAARLAELQNQQRQRQRTFEQQANSVYGTFQAQLQALQQQQAAESEQQQLLQQRLQAEEQQRQQQRRQRRQRRALKKQRSALAPAAEVDPLLRLESAELNSLAQDLGGAAVGGNQADAAALGSAAVAQQQQQQQGQQQGQLVCQAWQEKAASGSGMQACFLPAQQQQQQNQLLQLQQQQPSFTQTAPAASAPFVTTQQQQQHPTGVACVGMAAEPQDDSDDWLDALKLDEDGQGIDYIVEAAGLDATQQSLKCDNSVAELRQPWAAATQAAAAPTSLSSTGNFVAASPGLKCLTQQQQQQQQQWQQQFISAAVKPEPCPGTPLAATPQSAADNFAKLQLLASESDQQAMSSTFLARCTTTAQRELLVQLCNKEQQQVEQELDKITAQLKTQQYCMALHIHNVCTKKQLALKYLHCYPFIPEAYSFCEALDDMGW